MNGHKRQADTGTETMVEKKKGKWDHGEKAVVVVEGGGRRTRVGRWCRRRGKRRGGGHHSHLRERIKINAKIRWRNRIICPAVVYGEIPSVCVSHVCND